MLGKWRYTLMAAAAALAVGACSGGEKAAAPAASEASSAAQGEGKTYIVATDAAYAPFEYEENGQVAGFSHDVLEAVAAKEGLKLQFRNTPWEGIFATLDTGDADIVASSVTITDERKQSMDFSDPYFEATQMIAVGSKGSDITSFADLKTKKHTVSVQTGTTGDLVSQKLLGKDNPNIKRFETMPLALKELISGGVDASVGDNGVIQNFVTNNPNAKLKTIVDPTFEKEYYGFAVKKGRSDELLSKINAGLKAIKADGEYDKIYAKYFNDGSKSAEAAPASGAASAN